MNSLAGLDLVVSSRPSADKDHVAFFWEAYGGKVQHLRRSWEPPLLHPPVVRLYGKQLFCTELSVRLGLSLVSPPNDFLLQVDHKFVKRDLRSSTIGELKGLDRLTFVKPFQQKIFPSGVYSSFQSLRYSSSFLPLSTTVIVSEVVDFESEFRVFVANGEIVAKGCYFGASEEREVVSFFRDFVMSCPIPRAFVVDLGYIADRGWAIIEANPAWGSALRGCHPEGAIECISLATAWQGGNREQ